MMNQFRTRNILGEIFLLSKHWVKKKLLDCMSLFFAYRLFPILWTLQQPVVTLKKTSVLLSLLTSALFHFTVKEQSTSTLWKIPVH